jgi:hypothetical protein
VRLLRQTLPYLGVVILLAAGYDGWIFFSRWKEGRDARKAEARQQVEDTRRLLDGLGGDNLKILDFYATPDAIRRGERALICYGVNAAASVRIEPPVEQLHPAISHCFQVSPIRDTDYKLIVGDYAGHTMSASVSIKVAP